MPSYIGKLVHLMPFPLLCLSQGADVEVCSFYEGYEKEGSEATLSGVLSLDAMKALGRQKGWCPYYMARRCVNLANVVVFNYQVCMSCFCNCVLNVSRTGLYRILLSMFVVYH